MHIKRSTALIASVALLASAVIGFAIGKVDSHSTTTSNFHNSSSVGPPVVSTLGFYAGYGSVPRFQALETWLGRPAQHVVQFADGNATNFDGSVWGQVISAGAYQTIANRIGLVESIPLAFGGFVDTSTAAGQATVRTALNATVRGANDARFKVAANYLKTGGFPNAIIRLGWEFDGGWMPWSSKGNEVLWATAYRHVVNLFRSVSPRFRFDWNGDPSFLQTATAAYPGNAYVDIIGLDVYDKGIPVAWNSTTKAWTDPTAAWNWELTNLRFQRDFAIAHGKQVSYPEWGLSGVNATTTSRVGGDNPTFVQGMWDWMNSLPASGGGSLAYHSYFNEDASDGHHRLTSTFFPNAQARYRALFGTPGAVSSIPSATTTTASPTTVTVAPTTPTAPPATPTTVEATFSITITCGVVSRKCNVPAGLTGP